MDPSSERNPPLGRDSELATLDRALGDAAAGRGGIVWLEGEPGIGKSMLVSAAIAGAAARGCRAHRAVGDELGQQLPLRPLLDALGEHVTTDATQHQLADSAGIVAGGDAVPAGVERLLVAVDRLCATAPLVLAFDDLQWADEGSLLAWHRLSLAVDQIPLLLVSACRPVPVRPPVARLRRGVTSRGATMLHVGPLGEDAVAGLVARRVGAPPGPLLRQAVAHAGGNPLYTAELVDALLRDRRVRTHGDQAELIGTVDQVPLGLAGAINDRLDFLSADTTSTLRIAALLGPEFSVFDLATVTGRRTSALLSVLDEAMAAGVLAETGDRLAFRHGLLRQALYDATPASARSALHRQVGRALAEADLPVGQVATHLAMAPDALDGWAVDWLALHAAQLAYRAPELAADLLRTASQQLRDDDLRQESLLRGRARALLMLSRLDEAEAVARHVLAATTDPARAAETAWTLASVMLRAGRYADTLQILDDALERPGLPALWRARLRAWRTKALPGAGRRDEAEPEARWALAEGERLADRVTIGSALFELYMLSDYTTGIGYVRRALAAVGDSPEMTDIRILLHGNLAYSLDALGRPEPADAAMREAMMLAERSGTWRLPSVHVQTGRRYIEAGRWDDALAELLPLTGLIGLFESLLRLGGLALIAGHREDRDAAEDWLRRADELPKPISYLRSGSMLLYLARGVQAEQRQGPAAAAEVYADTVGAADVVDLYDRWMWLPDLVRLALAAGDKPLAEDAVAAAESDAAEEPELPRRAVAAKRARATLDGDVPALLAAAAEYEQLGSPLAVGQTYEEAAVLLAAGGDAAGARAALTDAVRAYLDLGAEWDVRRADSRLRRHGVRRGPRTVRRRPTTGWNALTPTEVRVAALVAEGRSNPDIAAAMLLSRRTVQTHVSNILAKLGLGSRIEIARRFADGVEG